MNTYGKIVDEASKAETEKRKIAVLMGKRQRNDIYNEYFSHTYNEMHILPKYNYTQERSWPNLIAGILAFWSDREDLLEFFDFDYKPESVSDKEEIKALIKTIKILTDNINML